MAKGKSKKRQKKEAKLTLQEEEKQRFQELKLRILVLQLQSDSKQKSLSAYKQRLRSLRQENLILAQILENLERESFQKMSVLSKRLFVNDEAVSKLNEEAQEGRQRFELTQVNTEGLEQSKSTILRLSESLQQVHKLEEELLVCRNTVADLENYRLYGQSSDDREIMALRAQVQHLQKQHETSLQALANKHKSTLNYMHKKTEVAMLQLQIDAIDKAVGTLTLSRNSLAINNKQLEAELSIHRRELAAMKNHTAELEQEMLQSIEETPVTLINESDPTTRGFSGYYSWSLAESFKKPPEELTVEWMDEYHAIHNFERKKELEEWMVLGTKAPRTLQIGSRYHR